MEALNALFTGANTGKVVVRVPGSRLAQEAAWGRSMFHHMKFVVWSTISGEVRLPPRNDPPCPQITAGRLVTVSPWGR
ncbi:hypothetical protein BH24ACT4_BH24ACT4_10760 [soil metagenome]